MRKYLPIVIVLAIGSALSVSLSWLFQKNEHDHAQDRFQEAALEHSFMIEDALLHTVQLLETLATLCQTSDIPVKRETFESLAMSLLSHHPYILGLNWAPRISHAQRESYEATARKDDPHFKITERDAQGTVITALPREEYYPAYSNVSLSNIRRAYGFDFASEPHRREALLRARDTGLPQATSQVKLVVDEVFKPSIIIFYPVYQKNVPLDTLKQRQVALQGFIVGVFRVEELVTHVLKPLNEKMVVLIKDESASDRERILYQSVMPSSESRIFSMFDRVALLIMGHFEEISLNKTVGIFGRTWSISCAPPSASPILGNLWIGLNTLWSGLLCTLAVVVYLFKSMRNTIALQEEVYRRHNIEIALRQAYDDLEEYNRNLTQKVAERTRQLADKNIQLQRNVSELQRAKEALRESEQHWHTLIEEAQIGLGLFQLDGGVIQVNRSLTHILGYSPEEFFDNQLTFIELSSESFLTKEKEKIQNFYSAKRGRTTRKTASKTTFHDEYYQWRFGPYEKTLVHKAGHLIPVRISGLMIERYGEPLIWANIEDISDLKQAEEALHKSQERIRHFFELPLIGMAIFSPEEGWLEVNDKLCDLFGYSKEELKNKSWQDLIHPEDFSLQWYQLLR